MISLRSYAYGLVAACGCSASMFASAAGPYSSVYAFGDSLSDMGNVYAASALTPPYVAYPALPAYANGRFSNGPVAVEIMTQQLTGAALTLSHDYAWGGARTGVSPISGYDNNHAELNGTGLQTQVTRFRTNVGAGQADPNALYVVWAGANDFTEFPVLLNLDGQQWARVIGNVTTAINSLAADGAKHFFVPNMPNLGLTPYVQSTGAANAAGASALTAGYNASFAAALTSLDAANAAIDIRTFDVHGFMTTVVAKVETDGSYLGLTNVTDPCQANPACTDPIQSFFWDDRHPSARVHQILGQAFSVAAAVPEPETYALLLAGLGVVGWATRRRARATA